MGPLGDRINILVGIPAHNEERAIADVVAGAALQASKVVVVDDGSTDLTAFKAHQAGAHIIRHKCNRGKGVAVAALFEYAKSEGVDVLVLIDGDGQHDPAEIPRLVQTLVDKHADVVVGSRYLSIRSDIPRDRSIGQRLFNTLTAAASGVKCSDSQSGFRAFSRRAICSMRITEASFSVECEQQFECQIHGLKLVEAPITCSYAPPEKRSPYRHGLQVLARLGMMAFGRRLLAPSPYGGRRNGSESELPNVPATGPVEAESLPVSVGD
jgi:glycosyltransferase involved in cell wall biosynthesis